MKDFEYNHSDINFDDANFDVETVTSSGSSAGDTPITPPQPAPNPGRPAHYASQKSRLPLVITLIAVCVLLVGTGLFFGIRALVSSPADTRETTFIEQKTEVVKQGEIIQINDPELGLIEIEAIEGVARNNYDKDNFRYDENGFLAYYIDGQKASCIGIDLSEFQGDVDFDALKNAGVDYVMLRLGGRFYGDEGAMYEDTRFSDYYTQAKSAGLRVGAYFFSQAASAEDAKEEGEYALRILGNKQLDYPVAFDWEIIADDDARTDGVSGEELTDIAEQFCDTVSTGGYHAIIYANTHLMYYMYDLTRMKDYEFWVADYGNFPTMYYGFSMWQYTTEGTIDGIDGTVDLNICFKNY